MNNQSTLQTLAAIPLTFAAGSVAMAALCTLPVLPLVVALKYSNTSQREK